MRPPGAGDDRRDALRARVADVRGRIAAACARSGRDPREVTLVAASKTVALPVLLTAREAGIDDFAENYARELAEKAAALPARWHFVGRLQEGTAAKVAAHADVLHGGEPGPALAKVARRAREAGRDLVCLVQVDFTGRRQGVAPEEVERALDEVASIPGLVPAGLMTLPPLTSQPEGARAYFRRLRDLREALRPAWPALVELSMGMSADYQIAVEEGATMVRVGRALFGPRPARGVVTGRAGGPSAG